MPRLPTSRFLRSLAAMALLGVGCVVSDDEQLSCANDNECPDLYSCVPGARGKYCSLPADAAGAPDRPNGGTGTEKVTYYCGAVQKALDRLCTSCHGAAPNRSGIGSFRTDRYEATGQVKGVKELASQIARRMTDAPRMPPASAPAQPTEDETALILAWVQSGAPQCSGSSQ